MKRKILYFLPILALLAVLLIWYDRGEEAEQHEELAEEESGFVQLSEEQIDHLGILVQEATPGELQLNLSARGRIILQPDNTVHILPKISGIVSKAHKNIGDMVQAGEILAVLSSREMAQLKADYLTCLEKEKLQLSLYDRERRLFQKQISSEQDYLNAQTAYEEARINVQSATQKLHSFGLETKEITNLLTDSTPSLCSYVIRSPMEGRIINRDISNGEFIESSSPIYTIADLNSVWLEVGIYPKDLFNVKEGQFVNISLPGSSLEQEAELIYVSPIIEEDTITAKAIAVLDNSQGVWRPGMFVQVSITTDQINAPLLIPKAAIQTMDSHEVVFVRTVDGFQRKEIRVGRNDPLNVEVLDGLAPGEPYAASQTFYLKAALIKVTEE